jgi:hypothetical protein
MANDSMPLPLLRDATHQHGIDAAHRQNKLTDDLFSIDGGAGIIRALDICNAMPDKELKDQYIQAIICWNGFAANEMQARKIIIDYLYFRAVVTSKRIKMLRIGFHKVTARNLAQFLPTLKLIKLPVMHIRVPVQPVALQSLLPEIELMLENVIGAHAPTAADLLPQAI